MGWKYTNNSIGENGNETRAKQTSFRGKDRLLSTNPNPAIQEYVVPMLKEDTQRKDGKKVEEDIVYVHMQPTKLERTNLCSTCSRSCSKLHSDSELG